MSKLYKKNEQGKFVSVGNEFTGWPTNGIWVVEDGNQSCMYQFKNKDLRYQPTPTLVSYMIHTDELCSVISKEWEKRSLSTNDIAAIACEFFALKSGGMKIEGEIIEN